MAAVHPSRGLPQLDYRLSVPRRDAGDTKGTNDKRQSRGGGAGGGSE